jgi:asparagine synthase (glutamine-hydrolysing)
MTLPLRPWADAMIEMALCGPAGEWLDASAVRAAWRRYCAGESDNSFYLWQWINRGLALPGQSLPARESGK